MALTYSSMLELDSKIPHFELKNVMDDKMYASTSFFNKKPSLIIPGRFVSREGIASDRNFIDSFLLLFFKDNAHNLST